MIGFLKVLFRNRRKQDVPVVVERRKMSRAAADERLCASIDRFQKTIVRKREELLK